MLSAVQQARYAANKIGTNSNYDAAAAILEGIYPYLKEKGIFLAAQCCEHLNRSIVIEEECRAKYNLAEVNAVPQPKAGGSFATNAYKAFNEPVLVETVPEMRNRHRRHTYRNAP